MDFGPGGTCARITSSFHHLPVVTKVRLPEGLVDGQPRKVGDQRYVALLRSAAARY